MSTTLASIGIPNVAREELERLAYVCSISFPPIGTKMAKPAAHKTPEMARGFASQNPILLNLGTTHPNCKIRISIAKAANRIQNPLQNP